MFPMRVMLFSLLAAAGSLAAQSPPTAWQYGHPDAKLLLGIDVKAFRQSTVGQNMRAQMASQMQLATAAMPLPFPLPALDFLDQIDRVFVSSPALNGGAKGAPVAGKAAANAPFLMVIEGRFSAKDLQPFATGAAHTFRGTEVRRLSKTGDGSLALLNASTVLLGDERSLHSAIEHHAQASATPLLARAMELSSKYDFWMILADSPSKFQSGAAANPLAAQIEGMEIGLAARDGMQLELSLNTKDEQAAQQFTQMLSSQLQFAATAKADNPETADLLKKLVIRAEGKQMRVNLALTQEEMDRQMHSLQNARASTGTTAAPVKAALPSKPGKVKIYGLDEGVREIQLSH